MNLNSRSFDLNVKAVGIFLNDGLRFNKAVGKMVFKNLPISVHPPLTKIVEKPKSY